MHFRPFSGSSRQIFEKNSKRFVMLAHLPFFLRSIWLTSVCLICQVVLQNLLCLFFFLVKNENISYEVLSREYSYISSSHTLTNSTIIIRNLPHQHLNTSTPQHHNALTITTKQSKEETRIAVLITKRNGR